MGVHFQRRRVQDRRVHGDIAGESRLEVEPVGLLLRMRKMEDLKPWGSIVYGPDGSKWGISWNHASRRAAVADARGNCAGDGASVTRSPII